MSVPGIGVLSALAYVSTIADVMVARRARVLFGVQFCPLKKGYRRFPKGTGPPTQSALRFEAAILSRIRSPIPPLELSERKRCVPRDIVVQPPWAPQGGVATADALACS
jgi:hypothetical protein